MSIATEASNKETDRPKKCGWPAGRPRPAQRHGLTTLKRAVGELGGRLIDRRTAVGKALGDWMDALMTDLGGADNLSTQQKALVETAVRTKLLLDSTDAYLLSQPSIINKRKRSMIPVVQQRNQLADTLTRQLTLLGLERRAKPVPSLQRYLEQRQLPAPALAEAQSPAPAPAEGES